MEGQVLYEMRFKLGIRISARYGPSSCDAKFRLFGEVSGPSLHGKVHGDYFAWVKDIWVDEPWRIVTHTQGEIIIDDYNKIVMDAIGYAEQIDNDRLAVKEYISYKTTSWELAWLNSTKGISGGFYYVNTGELNATAFKVDDAFRDGNDSAEGIIPGLTGWLPLIASDEIQKWKQENTSDHKVERVSKYRYGPYYAIRERRGQPNTRLDP